MNKLNLLLGILIGITITACSSDDNTDTTNQDELIGIWNLKSVENQGNDVPVFGCGVDQTTTFNSENAGSEYFPEDYNAAPCEFITLPFTWTRDDNQLLITVPEEGIFINEIVRLTDTELQIVVVETNGNAVPQEQQEIFKFEK